MKVNLNRKVLTADACQKRSAPELVAVSERKSCRTIETHPHLNSMNSGFLQAKNCQMKRVGKLAAIKSSIERPEDDEYLSSWVREGV